MRWTIVAVARLPARAPRPRSRRRCAVRVIAHEPAAGRRPGSPTGERRECWSGRLDLNQRPPAPEAGALPGYATPRSTYPLYTPGPSRLPGILAHQLHEHAPAVGPLRISPSTLLITCQHLPSGVAHRHHHAPALARAARTAGAAPPARPAATRMRSNGACVRPSQGAVADPHPDVAVPDRLQRRPRPLGQPRDSLDRAYARAPARPAPRPGSRSRCRPPAPSRARTARSSSVMQPDDEGLRDRLPLADRQRMVPVGPIAAAPRARRRGAAAAA